MLASPAPGPGGALRWSTAPRALRLPAESLPDCYLEWRPIRNPTGQRTRCPGPVLWLPHGGYGGISVASGVPGGRTACSPVAPVTVRDLRPPSVTSPTGNVTRLPYRDGRQIASPTLPANGSRTTAGLAWFARRSSLFVRATGGSPATPAAHVLFPVIVPRPGPATRSRTSHVTRHNRDHVPFTTTALARGGFTFLPSSPGFDQHL